ncbi:hypothetical protein C6P43_002234 [Kluyveromyces marxianus]|nr:hypothetical protein C6P43_002234 [Kluyveromyces marxianus]
MASTAQAAAIAAMNENSGGQVPYRANNEHLHRVVQSVTDATKRLSQISTASSTNANTKTSKRKNRDTVGPWKLGKTLGKGSSGRVRLAKNMETGKLSAIKIVPKKYVRSNQSKQLPYGIEREIIIMKLISHPNVMGLYEVWENKSELYLVLEYVEGGELFDYLVSKGKLPEEEAIHYFKQIIQAVAYCHGFNICHRDLKPENLLLDKKKKSIKIADFGMAALETSDRLLETSCGSPHYASPEIVLGQKYHGSPSDVWSCGIILFALLTGHLPFNDDNVKKLLLKVQSGKYQMPQGLSVEAKDLISRILVVDPNKRITIDQILQHELLTKYDSKARSKSNSNLNLLKNTPSIINFTSEQEIDGQILSNLQILWHGAPRKHLVTRLLKSGFTEEKMFYSLLWNYQQKQQKVVQKDSTPVSVMQNSSASSVSPLKITTSVETDGSGNGVTTNTTYTVKPVTTKGGMLPASMTPTIPSFGNQQQAPRLQQKSQFSINSLKNAGHSKSPKKTKQGFIASSSSSKLFNPNVGARPLSQSISKSSSKKSLVQAQHNAATTPKTRTLHNSSSKRSLYSLQSISKRSVNLKDLLQDELIIPPLPEIDSASSQHTSTKIASIVDGYGGDDTMSLHGNNKIESITKPAFQLHIHNPQSNKNILAQPKLNESSENQDQTPSSSTLSAPSEKLELRTPFSSTVPLKDVTNTFHSKNTYVSSLDPKHRKAKPSIENLLRKVAVPQRMKSKSSIRKMRDSGDWTVSGEAKSLFGDSMYENQLQRLQTNPSKITAPETVISTSTPMPNAKSGLLRMPSMSINSSMTFKDLSQLLMHIDEENDNADTMNSKNRNNTDKNNDNSSNTNKQGLGISIIRHNLRKESSSNDLMHRFETSSNYDDYEIATSTQAATTGADIDIFEDAPGDSNESVTTSESVIDQSQPNLKKKAASIDSINTSHVLTPANDVRVSLYVNQMDKLECMPRETTEQIISKFKLSPIKDSKQKRFSYTDRDMTLSGSIISMFKDLDGDDSHVDYEDGGLLSKREVDHQNLLEQKSADSNSNAVNDAVKSGTGPTTLENDEEVQGITEKDLLAKEKSLVKDSKATSGGDSGKRVTLLFDDRISESERVFKAADTTGKAATNKSQSGLDESQNMGTATVNATANTTNKRRSYINKLSKIKEDDGKGQEISRKQRSPNNWFVKLLHRLKTSSPKSAVYQHKSDKLQFDELHILLVAEFGKNGIDCELKKLERKGNKEHVSYSCSFGRRRKFSVSMACNNGVETVISCEAHGSKFVSDAKSMELFEHFNEALANAISIKESK